MTGTALGNTLSNEHAAYMNDSATRIPSVGLNCGTPRTAIDSNEDLASSRQEHPAQEMRSALVGSSPARPEAIERPVSLLSGLSCLSGEKDTSKHDVEREGCSPAVPPIVRQGSDCRKQPERMIRECLVSEKQGRGTNGLRTQIVRAGEQHRPVAYASSDIEMDTNEQEERTVQILVRQVSRVYSISIHRLIHPSGLPCHAVSHFHTFLQPLLNPSTPRTSHNVTNPPLHKFRRLPLSSKQPPRGPDQLSARIDTFPNPLPYTHDQAPSDPITAHLHFLSRLCGIHRAIILGRWSILVIQCDLG